MHKILFKVAVFATMVLLTACNEQKSSDSPVHSVILTQPENNSELHTKTFAGTVEEAREISVAFKTDGQVSRIAVKEGDYVREGQLIAQLDEKDYQLGMDAAQIQYDQLSREVERLRKLHEGNSISGNDFDKAVSGLMQVEINLKSFRNKMSYCKLYAPTSGYVKSVNFEVAEMIGAGSPMINLLDVKQMEVSINIPASLYMQRDQIKSFLASGLFGSDMALKLISITPKADSNQLYYVRLALPQSDTKNVTSGQNVEVKVVMNEQEGASTELTVPLSSVVKEGSDNYVFVYKETDNSVHRTKVTIDGLDSRGRVIVKSGLIGNEKIVKAGAQKLADKEIVKLANL